MQYVPSHAWFAMSQKQSKLAGSGVGVGAGVVVGWRLCVAHDLHMISKHSMLTHNSPALEACFAVPEQSLANLPI